ncbi:hypothetical protein K1719_002115 [Acacia pycnantha]|nr:hypothetical protein K1719_002115 [Acacia pycnantha]
MILVEHEVWDRDSGFDRGFPSKLFVLVDSSSFSMGVGNRGNFRNGELPSLSLRHLLRGRKIFIVDDNSVSQIIAADVVYILGVFDELHVRIFLDPLMVCVVRILGSCALSLDNTRLNEFPACRSESGNNSFSQRDGVIPRNKVQTTTTLKQFKDMRSLCLRIVSFVLIKYEDHKFGSDLWDLFFASEKPFIDRFK